jgi:tetratricopeptide (TPR) repeat protein
LAVAGGPEPEPFESDPEVAKAQALYDEGKAKFDTTHYEDAIRLWTEAYGILSDTPENAPIKAAIIYNLSTAQERAFEIDKDVTHLRRAVVLMEQYAASIPDLFGEGEEAEAESQRIDERIADVRARIEEAEGADAPTVAPTEPAPRPAEPTTTDAPPDPRARAFVIAGATLTAVGVVGLGIMAGGLALGSNSNDLSDLDPDDLDARRERFDRGRAGNVMAWVGGAIGGAALITGAVLLGVGLKRRSASKTAAAPLLGPGVAGVSLRGSF